MKSKNLKTYFLSAKHDINLVNDGSGQSLTPEMESKMISYGWQKTLEKKTENIIRYSFELSVGAPSHYEYNYKSWKKEKNTENSPEWYLDLCSAMEIDPRKTCLRRKLTNLQDTNSPT